MVSSKRSYVQQAFDEGFVCVFPTEVAARSYLVDYALHSKNQAILSGRAISFDTFRAMFLQHEAHLAPSNSLVRSLFVHQVLEQGLPLTSLMNPRYPEARNRFLSYIASILPSLKQACDEEVLSLLEQGMQRDLILLYQQYRQFLAEHALFEPRYAEPSLPNDWDASKRYCILFSDTISGSEALYASLGAPSWLSMQPTPATDLATMEVFGNHVMEIRTTLRRIRSLLGRQVPAHSIVIGCAAPQILLPVLEEEAALYDIPLVIREGRQALQYPSGRFLSGLQEVYDDQFSLESLKSLLLDPDIPYKDRGLHHRFLARAVDKSIVHGSLKAKDQFTEMLKDSELCFWYRSLKQSIVDIVTASDIEMLRRKLNHFQDTYFRAEQWRGTEDEDVYSFCLDAIDHIKVAMEKCSLSTYPNLFSYLLSYLQTKPYVPQQHKEGIAVYAWPQAAPLIADHLFFLGLDGEAAATVERPLAFLPAHIHEALRREVDTTKATLLCACMGDGSVTLSCHSMRYEGHLLPPSMFLEEDALLHHSHSPNLCEDPYLEELQLYKERREGTAAVLPSQRRFFLQARRTSLRLRKDDYTRHPIPRKLVSQLKEERSGRAMLELSPTKIDLFDRCPYAFLAHYLYKVTKEEYDVERVDHLMIGNLLHLVYQRFFSEIVDFNPALLGHYRERLSTLFDDVLTELYGSEGPTPSIRSWIIASYREAVAAILGQEAKLFSHTRSILFEQELAYEMGDLYLHGRIDRIICLNPPDGKRYVVIDYKKGEAPMTKLKTPLDSYQLPLYRNLVEQVLDAHTSVAAYYSVKEGRYRCLWTDENSEEALFGDELLSERLSSLAESVEAGHFMATPSKKHCSGCDYRSLCRRRFATR
ncbi:PD-(D/E)XK nuclease family protein [uncultured Sphaerochaeta sp.]|uniref:PD-(D/E)XK nuclease family protein n=1 Tax=uncultured Sphaerochaeta sp. TaxID=886478 RepID=UPI0026193699|nr:PD-(D/E)XK nuclease family protein [uncultured Sphaerochaeta sp.]